MQENLQASWLFGYHIIGYMIFGYLYSIGYIGMGYLSSYAAEFWDYFLLLVPFLYWYPPIYECKKDGISFFYIPPVL